MYPFRFRSVYVTEWAAPDDASQERLQRICDGFGVDDAQVVDVAELAELVEARGWNAPVRTGALPDLRERDLVLNSYQWDGSTQRDVEQYPALHSWTMGSEGPWGWRDAGLEGAGSGSVCQSAWELHSIYGCLHACRYCHVGRLVNVMLNLEQVRDRLHELFALQPSQRLYKYDNQTDTVCFEPEYGASETFVPFFGEQDSRYLMLYTKSDNVDHLLDLPHNGHTLINWTLSPQPTCETVEIGAPGMSARIEAAAKCQAAGYRVRFRFSPIVPLRTWREDLGDMVGSLFRQVDPDLITVDVLGWMRPWQMSDAMNIEAFADDFRDEAWSAVASGDERPGKHFFSHDLRLSILREVVGLVRSASPATPISLCNETRRMWADLADLLPYGPNNYACCCGPDSVPGCRGLR